MGFTDGFTQLLIEIQVYKIQQQKPLNEKGSIYPYPMLAIRWLIKLPEQRDSYDKVSIKLAVLASNSNKSRCIDLRTYLNALSLLLSDTVKKKKNPPRCQRSSSSSLASS